MTTPTYSTSASVDLRVIVDNLRAWMQLLHEAMCDNATSFTCGEAETVAGIYEAVGLNDEARQFLTMHATGDDDESDQHVAIYDSNGYAIDYRDVDDDE